jgi:hypothetical protein
MRRDQQISEARAKANRRNARKSTGPRTAAGKTMSPQRYHTRGPVRFAGTASGGTAARLGEPSQAYPAGGSSIAILRSMLPNSRRAG